MALLEEYLQEYKDWQPIWMEKRRFAFISSRSGYMQIWERDLDADTTKQRTFFRCAVMQLIVNPATREMFFTLDINGSENGQPFVMGYDDETPWQLLDEPKWLHQLIGVSKDGKTLYYLSNARRGAISDVCCLQVDTGEQRVLFEPDEPNSCPAGMSPNGRYLLYNVLASYDSKRLYCLDRETGECRKIPNDNVESTEDRPSWTADSRFIYLCSNRDRDFHHVVRYDMEKDVLESVYGVEKGECRMAALSPDGRYLAVAITEDGYDYIDLLKTEGYAFIRRIEPIKAGLGATGLAPEQFVWSLDSRFVVFPMSNGTHPCRLWMNDVETGCESMVTSGGVVPPETLVDAALQEFTSFDGLQIPYFLYLPKGREGEKDLPVLIDIHGGPECQRYCEYDPFLQYISSKGVAVVAPNIRGSSGYGKKYCHLDDREKRLDSVKDIEFLVNHLVEKRIADPKRIAVHGVSYGGFMVLSCCARLPDYWACAVARVGMYNLETFIKNTSPYRRAWRASEYGSLEDGDLLYSVSPVAKAENMKTPILVIHGANDPRVPFSETEQLVEMLQKKNVDVELVQYADEGHGLTKYPNIVDCYTKTTDFLLKYLS